MDFILDVNWISLLALIVFFLVFVLLRFLTKKINWLWVILLSLVFGTGLGILFSSANNEYLIWVELIGDMYINIIKSLVAPIIFISIFTSFVQLKNKKKMKGIGFKSVAWLLVSASIAIVLSIAAGTIFKIGSSASSIFSNMDSISDSTVDAYQGLSKSFNDVILGLTPSNLITDFANNNVVAIIIVALAFAIGYISVASKEGESKVETLKNVIFSTKRILFKILQFVVNLTPYAVLCLVASSASNIFTNRDSIIQLLILVGLIYLVAIIHTYIANGLLIKFVAKLNPFKFFKKTFPAQVTAFTTQSSVGTLPITTSNLKNKVGVKEDVANFTASLGTTIGMPGCTCIWPVLLVIFYINAAGISWGFVDYLILAVITLVMSLGSAGVPGIAIVSAVGLFSALNLPIEAVILFIPINTISDMIRTLNNVSTATVASAIVARQEGQLDDNIFDTDIDEFVEEINESSDEKKASYEDAPAEIKEKTVGECCGSTFLDEEDSDEEETVILLSEEDD